MRPGPDGGTTLGSPDAFSVAEAGRSPGAWPATGPAGQVTTIGRRSSRAVGAAGAAGAGRTRRPDRDRGAAPWSRPGRPAAGPAGHGRLGAARSLLDLKESAQGGTGPHGLCIGATGSGKCELLRTLVLGLAATHTVDELNLVLVDFKGGATFLGLADLPHVSAVITNLADELTLVDRMADALAGEITRRQELLRAAGNLANLSRLRGGPADPARTCRSAARAADRRRRVLRAARAAARR